MSKPKNSMKNFNSSVTYDVSSSSLRQERSVRRRDAIVCVYLYTMTKQSTLLIFCVLFNKDTRLRTD